jgi:uncharacterized protein (DUF1778 family)
MPSESRTETLRLRVSPEEKAAIEAAAAPTGMGVSEFLREKALVAGHGRVKRAAPNSADADFIERRAAELEREGLPGHSARILAARERHRTGHRIGDVFSPPVRRDDPAKRARLTALREAFAREVGRAA